MASPARKPGISSPQLEEAVLAMLLRLQDEDGYVSNTDVRNAAAALMCSTRRVRNMIRRRYVRRPRTCWTPSEDLITDLVRSKGSVADLHRNMENPPVSKRTMQRRFA